jgi:hypothetical protein
MTVDERLSKIEDKIDTVLEIVHSTIPKVKDHQNTLYGNGKPGLKEDFAKHVEAEKFCPAKLAYTDERKKTHIAMVAVVISGISLICTIVLVVLTVASKWGKA